MGTTIRVTAPNPQYSGAGPGNAQFDKGVAEVGTDQIGALAYYRSAGYGVGDGEATPPETPVQPDSREVGVQQHAGTRLRDAAVDPRAGDFLVPTNAGQADPHGPAVAAPGVHAAPPLPVVPGPVPDDPAEQEQRETEAAQRILVDGEPVTGPELSRPAQSANKAAWVDWAVSQGAGQEFAAGLTKAELIDLYGSD